MIALIKDLYMKISENIYIQEDIENLAMSFKTDLLKGLKLDSTSCKRFRTRQCY